MIGYRSLALSVSAWLLVACGASQVPVADQATQAGAGAERSESVVAASAELTVRCPSQDLAAFVRAFADRVELQKQFTAQPLRMDSLDATAQPEPQQISREVSGDAIPFPVMPDAAQQRREGLELKVGQARDGEAEVILQKPDTGYRMSFMFRKNDCWQLYRVSDDSL